MLDARGEGIREAMKIHYVSCFAPNDPAELPLRTELLQWELRNDVELSIVVIQHAEGLREHLISLVRKALDVLIIGGHGHSSLSGFLAGEDPIRWHDVAVLLRGTLAKNCSFIFYSCNGGYPGMAPMFAPNSGPDFAFGPYIKAEGDAMTHATKEILTWKLNGGGDPSDAIALIDIVNRWARATYIAPYDQSFLRVTWQQGQKILRYPTKPSSDRFTKPLIKLRGWGRK